MNEVPFSILIAEDDEDDRIFMDEAFKQIGYEAQVKKFINGEYLLQYLTQISPIDYPSLIILDNTLPKLDASDMLHILKNSSLYRNILVIVYSTSISPHKKEQLLSLGAYACIEKSHRSK